MSLSDDFYLFPRKRLKNLVEYVNENATQALNLKRFICELTRQSNTQPFYRICISSNHWSQATRTRMRWSKGWNGEGRAEALRIRAD